MLLFLFDGSFGGLFGGLLQNFIRQDFVNTVGGYLAKDGAYPLKDSHFLVVTASLAKGVALLAVCFAGGLAGVALAEIN